MTRDLLLLAIDQGTTSTRAIAFDRDLHPVASASFSLETSHPAPGFAEQDPEAILESVVATVETVLGDVGGPDRVAAVGLDNQGESVVAWDATSGEALSPVVLWQCRRSTPIVERLRAAGHEPRIRAMTGLPLDPYFSAGKLTWLLEENDAVHAAADRDALRMGTVDAWLTARLDDGDARTDPSTASRTQLFGLASGTWDQELLRLFGVQAGWLPRIVRSVGDLGGMGHARWGGRLPLKAMLCDQQAALAGHGAFRPGQFKATLGTGVFILANAGETARTSADVETSIGWVMPDASRTYVLQGGVFTAGTFLGWLRDDLGLLREGEDLDVLVGSVPDAGGVRILPALAGLGTPWWRPDATAVVAGATATTGRAHLARAAVDGLAHLSVDVLDAMDALLPVPPGALRVDGGLSSCRSLVDRLTDLSGRPVEVAAATESTALGIAGMAGVGADLTTLDEIATADPVQRRVEPTLAPGARADERSAWRRFVTATGGL